MRWIAVALAVLVLSCSGSEPSEPDRSPIAVTESPLACPTVEEAVYLGLLGDTTTRIEAVVARFGGALDAPPLAEVDLREMDVYIAELERLRGPDSVAALDKHAKNTAHHLREFVASIRDTRLDDAERELRNAQRGMVESLSLITGFCEASVPTATPQRVSRIVPIASTRTPMGYIDADAYADGLLCPTQHLDPHIDILAGAL